MHLRRECAARICVDGSECSRPQVACSGNGAAPLAPQHVPAHRESQQLRPWSSWVPYGSHSGAAAIGAVAPASVAVNAADLQRHWLHSTCQPIVSRISCDLLLWLGAVSPSSVAVARCDLALAGCRMAVTAAAIAPALRPSAEQVRPGTVQAACIQTRAIAMPRAAPLAPLHVPAHRESNQLRPCSSWVPCGSHSGAAAISAVAPASVAVAQLHLRRWQ